MCILWTYPVLTRLNKATSIIGIDVELMLNELISKCSSCCKVNCCILQCEGFAQHRRGHVNMAMSTF